MTNRAQQNQLQVLTVDQRRTTLTDNDDHTAVRHAASLAGRSVRRDVHVAGRTHRHLDLRITKGNPVRRVTADSGHRRRSRVVSRTVEWLSVHLGSNRNLEHLRHRTCETEELFQVTNVVTGATRPTIHPSMERIAYQQYSENGWDVIVLDWDPESFLPRGKLPRPVRYDAALTELTGAAPDFGEDDEEVAVYWDDRGSFVDPSRKRFAFNEDRLGYQNPPTEGLDSFDTEDIKDLYGDEADYPFTITPKRYNPVPTLLPRFWAPSLALTTEPAGPTFEPFTPTILGVKPAVFASASTGSSDPLRHWAWTGWANYRTDAEYLGGGGSITLNRFLPVYSIGGSTRVIPRAKVPIVDPNNPVDPNGELVIDRVNGPTYWEQRRELLAQVSWPYRLQTTVFANYAYTDRQSYFELPDEAWLPEIPLRGNTGAISAGWRYSWAQQTPLAISLEDAQIFSLVGSFLHPYLGTRVVQDDGSFAPLTQLQVTSELRNYWVNPWIPNHVLAVRGAAGLTVGGTDFLGNYLLGGPFGDGAFYVTPDGSYMLRGYTFGADIGDMFWTANAEYRFPIWYVQRGVGTIPAFVRNVSGLVFVDTGNAFNNPTTAGRAATAAEFANAAFSQPLVSVGGEVLFSGIFGWAAGLNGRLGYGYGLTPHGIRPESPGSFYFQLGGTF